MYHNIQTSSLDKVISTKKRRWPFWLLVTALLLGLAGLTTYGLQRGVFFANPGSTTGSSEQFRNGTVDVQREAVTGTWVGGDSQTGTNRQEVGGLSRFAQFEQGFDVRGRIVPARKAELSIAHSGIVSTIYVEEDERVLKGQLLLKLDSVNEDAEVLRAEAQLQQVTARLAQLKNSVRPSDLLAAQASVDGAKARLAQLQNGEAPGAIAAAQAQVAASEAARQKLYQGPNQAAVAAAQAELENAQKYRDDAQKSYDRVSWSNDIGSLPESSNLQQATNAYNAAKARLDALYVGATAADSAQADANLNRSQAQLNALTGSLPAQVLEAEANLRLFEAQLLRLQEGAIPEEIAVAEAEIRAAEATLKQVLSALDDTELRAPFDSVIAILNVTVGEYISPSDEVIRIADMSEWEIETSDLTEREVLGITAGESVLLEFDALPDETMAGVVKYVRPFGESLTNETIYKVVITPDKYDNRFLWNMSTYITFNEKPVEISGGLIGSTATSQ